MIKNDHPIFAKVILGDIARLNRKMGSRKYENGIRKCRSVDDIIGCV